jgi:hypothetical protein
MTDDYNHFIGGVDIANQLRANFSTQQRGFKPWRPLFYWLLDSTIINAYLLYEHQRKAKLQTKDKLRSTHRTFRESLVLALLSDPSASESTHLVQQYITKNTQLPHIRLTRPIEIHFQVLQVERCACMFCRWQRHNEKGRTTRAIAKSNNIPKTKTLCNHCRVPLCNKCFYIFHYFVN